MAVAAVEELDFHSMDEAELRQWVEANPGRVNDRDRYGFTPLTETADELNNLSLVVWLLDKQGLDVTGTTGDGSSALHHAASLDILNALMNRGADPTLPNLEGAPPLMHQAAYQGTVKVVARLLHDPRVRATINVQDRDGDTVLRFACKSYGAEAIVAAKVHLLLQAGANPTTIDNDGQAPLDFSRQTRPHYQAVIAHLEQTLAEAEKSSLLVKTRRLAVAATSNTVAPSCLQARVARGSPCRAWR